jgi:hypothetical protein
MNMYTFYFRMIILWIKFTDFQMQIPPHVPELNWFLILVYQHFIYFGFNLLRLYSFLFSVGMSLLGFWLQVILP